MGRKKTIVMFILSFLSIFLPFFPKKKNRITFVSLTMDTLQGNFKLIAEGVSKEESIKVYTMLTKYKKNWIGNFLYLVNCIKQLFIINTSKVVILNDNNFVVSNFKKDYPTVLQLWHASGALKKFGNEIHREYEIKNYDYVVATSDVWKPVYAKSFHIQEERVLPLGLPCTDELFHEEVKEKKKRYIYEKYPALVGKYVVLYAPTFRGNIIKGMKHLDVDLDNVIRHLSDEYAIVYKLHPLLKDVKLGNHERVINGKDEDLYGLFALSDCLISDYSSILFDHLLLEKKQLYYIPDYEQYNRRIGTNVDLKQMPGSICESEEELIQCLKDKDSFSVEQLRSCKELYFKYSDDKSTQRVVQLIVDIWKDEK